MDEIDKNNRREFNNTMEKLDEKVGHLRNKRNAVANNFKELTYTQASISKTIDNLDQYASQIESKLDQA